MNIGSSDLTVVGMNLLLAVFISLLKSRIFKPLTDFFNLGTTIIFFIVVRFAASFAFFSRLIGFPRR